MADSRIWWYKVRIEYQWQDDCLISGFYSPAQLNNFGFWQGQKLHVWPKTWWFKAQTCSKSIATLQAKMIWLLFSLRFIFDKNISWGCPFSRRPCQSTCDSWLSAQQTTFKAEQLAIESKNLEYKCSFTNFQNILERGMFFSSGGSKKNVVVQNSEL